ncbi:MAG: hypothetical protein IKB10_03430 [Alphaproteobacteria bacterium]|nr:hypothetical protein [Alphaproteobacteria bacterium]
MSEPTPIIKRGPSELQIVEEQIESLQQELIDIGQNASAWQTGHIKVEIKKLIEKRNKLLAEKDAKEHGKTTPPISQQTIQQMLATKNAGAGMN